MQKSLFFDGQDVQVSDLANIETTTEAEVTRRLVDMSVSQGIITGLTVSQVNPFELRVALGSAYDSNGQWINQNLNPALITFANPADLNKYLVIQYTNVDGTPVEHPITGRLNNTRRTDGFQLALTLTPAGTDVILTKITAIDGGGTATLDNTVRVFWGARIAPNSVSDAMLVQSDGVITHINTFGTGTVTSHNPHGLAPADIGFVDNLPNHQKYEHVSGVETQGTTDGLVTVDSSTNPDRATITQIAGGQGIQIGGVRTASLTPLTITWLDGTVNPGLYEVLYDTLGNATKSLRAAYSALQNITGVQVVDVSANHELASRVLAYSSGAKTLSWNSGPTVTLNAPSGTYTGDQFYLLRNGADETQTIRVWVDYSSLPGSNQNDTIAINASGAGLTSFLAATIFWSGTATGFLGYGNYNTSGQAYDQRVFGNLGTQDLNTALYEAEFRTRMADTRTDGFVLGLGFGPAGLNLTINYHECYVRGKKFFIPKTVLGLPDNTANLYIYVNDVGAWTFTTYDPAVVQPEEPPRIARGFHATTVAGAITVLNDQRVFLNDLDRFYTRSNIFTAAQTFNAAVTISEGDVHHGDRVMMLPASMAEADLSAWVLPTAAGLSADFWKGVGATGIVSYPLVMQVGARIKEVYAYIKDNAAQTVALELWSGAPNNKTLQNSVTSSGAGAYQTLSITGLSYVVAVDTIYNILIRGGLSANHISYGCKLVFDLP